MKDVNSLTRPYKNALVATRLRVALQLYLADRAARPASYDAAAVFHSHNPLKSVSHVTSPVPVTTCTLRADPVAPPSLTISVASYPNHQAQKNTFLPSPSRICRRRHHQGREFSS